MESIVEENVDPGDLKVNLDIMDEYFPLLTHYTHSIIINVSSSRIHFL